MRTLPSNSRVLRGVTATAAVASLAAGLAACGGDSDAATRTQGASAGSVTVGALSNGAAKETKLKVSEVKSISAELPKSVAKSGTLRIGVGALPAGFAPLAYVGGDQKTLTGAEPDLGRLVAAVLGLEPEVKNSTWENLFVGIDSGKVDVAFSNVTDTEERKKKYEFASYRQDNLGFEVQKKSTWNFGGDYRNLAGKTVAVSAGTNQEKILLEWKAKLAKEGKKLNVKYYQDNNATALALSSGKIDVSFGPNPGIAYHVTQTAKTPNPTRNAGTFSGAGESLQGLIAATAKKDSGLAKPLADAINHLVKNGQYAKWLAAWNLSNEAVDTSQVNPPGLPLSNS
ncbi:MULTISPECIES: ABC transporter substrate-binding protein [unclassified Streptomyces]|uniref:ABC transporter substrate-binding protein n=1 Tax=unclassified Streptomyces TaxID=2593676 RepID=UPI0013BD4C45|nr:MULTISPECIES: ABC transporter substrate-binding protein [unclassified Streptomyces]MCX5136837.1 ABC transporter substrate-binding protein [Streptomyces sp. NBC_00340]MCX5285213.1 ABC transporter substrate-binding protein [Streptomyces sp. NBC_00198]NEB28782.1 ABC transporter substrate-binding protein [Streptomyces sp. SID14446]WSK65358.1 ABC transporter substrate-binding protein [Streptomyces sp. NBC_01281]